MPLIGLRIHPVIAIVTLIMAMSVDAAMGPLDCIAFMRGNRPGVKAGPDQRHDGHEDNEQTHARPVSRKIRPCLAGEVRISGVIADLPAALRDFCARGADMPGFTFARDFDPATRAGR